MRWREKEIPTSAARSLLWKGMLIIVVCVVSSRSHFGSMNE